ncbi:Putative manganese efflux pump MntP [Syntrophomonas zehnderi OL-4]|uniref:Putative manganese efflux pump MntP n=1 Tax=Syntrophomonas zehnderi OL-4 TaxID=690567 RepID=A0A0E4G905_9FIRM|nr:manganese efflux pump MntP family protein [Syntrophomonas zehnderi]CFX02700.1 Putative manganese efflux pump MntP [Syntrophomonas zehnderi OL-4]
MQGQLLTVLLVAIVLGMDAFSLALGMGIKGVSKRYERRFTALVTVFHILMPLLGLYLGMAAGNLLGIWAGRIGAIILAYIGLQMIIKAWREMTPRSFAFKEAREHFRHKSSAPSNREEWISMLLLTVSVSIDALTVGFSLGTAQAPLLLTVVIIGAMAGSMTMFGFKGGQLFSRMAGTYSQAAGGLVLIALAVKMAF